MTQIYRIEVWARSGSSLVRLFFLQGILSHEDVERLCAEILVDPVTEHYNIDDPYQPSGLVHWVDVTLHPGVTDSVAANLMRSARLLGIEGLVGAASGHRYLLMEPLDQVELERRATTEFANPVIQHYAIDTHIPAPFVPVQTENDRVEAIPLKDANDAVLMQISRERRLSLDINEMRDADGRRGASAGC